MFWHLTPRELADLCAAYEQRKRETAAWVCLIVNNLGTRKEPLRVEDIFSSSPSRSMTKEKIAATRAALAAVAANLQAKRPPKEAPHDPPE